MSTPRHPTAQLPHEQTCPTLTSSSTCRPHKIPFCASRRTQGPKACSCISQLLHHLFPQPLFKPSSAPPTMGKLKTRKSPAGGMGHPRLYISGRAHVMSRQRQGSPPPWLKPAGIRGFAKPECGHGQGKAAKSLIQGSGVLFPMGVTGLSPNQGKTGNLRPWGAATPSVP